MKRSVEPDSPQSSVACGEGSGRLSLAELPGTGRTRKPVRVRATRAPSASRHDIVASMSADVDVQSTSVVPGANAAQMRRRCASDLDEGAITSPESAPGWMMTFKGAPA